MKIEAFINTECFEWDNYNINKILLKHSVNINECEEALLGEIIITVDEKHSSAEQRYNALGITTSQRLLFIVFTIRNKKIRVISARPMCKKEREVYYEKIKTNTQI